ARAADAGVRHVTVTGDLVGRVDDDDALLEVVGEHARGLAEQRGLADTGTAEEEDRSPAFDDVADDLDGTDHSAADATGEADDVALSVTQRRDAVQRALDAGAVVLAEAADARRDVLQVFVGD